MKPICPSHFPWKDYKKYTYPLGLDLGSICFLSGTSASEYDAATEKIVARGDLPTQTKTALEKIGTILTAAGYSFADTVSLIQYVTPAAFEQLNELNPLFQGHGIDLSSIHVAPVDRLMRRDALIELELIAARPNACKSVSRHPYVARVDCGDDGLLFIGKIADGVVRQPVSEAIVEEVAAVSAALAAAGIGWSHVARCRLALASRESHDLDEAVTELRRVLPGLPVVPVVGVIALPAARRAQLSVEICAEEPGSQPELAAAGGGLVRRVGPLLIATGLCSDDSGLDLVGQYERIFGAVIPELLTSEGMNMSGIIQTVEWVTADVLPSYRDTGAVRRKYLREPFPVASGLVCSALPAQRKIAVDIIAIDRQFLP
jgi:enamine deaminase RidA (YjgF/YER057c/UK114 family)